jgi:hypothetical protein
MYMHTHICTHIHTCICTYIYRERVIIIKKTEILSFAAEQTVLEDIKLSKVSKIQKNRHCTFFLIFEN